VLFLVAHMQVCGHQHTQGVGLVNLGGVVHARARDGRDS
jgi:hypothetical protein